MSARVGLFFVAWCALSAVAGFVAGRVIAAAYRQPTPRVTPTARQAVEPATDVSPSQAPALPPEIRQLIGDLHRQIEEAKLRYVAANGIHQLESMLAHPANGDDCPPHGIPRPEVDE